MFHLQLDGQKRFHHAGNKLYISNLFSDDLGNAFNILP